MSSHRHSDERVIARADAMLNQSVVVDEPVAAAARAYVVRTCPDDFDTMLDILGLI